VKKLTIAVCCLFVLLAGATAQAEVATLTKVFDHQLLVNSHPQSWEHRIDLPEAAAFTGRIFRTRRLQLEGRLVIEAEELTPTYYYVKVRLPKHFQEPARGILTVTLTYGEPVTPPPAPAAPTDLKIAPISAARKPAFTWKAAPAARYGAITLYDLDTNQTVWERVSVKPGVALFDEGYLPLHRYLWAVKVSDEHGRWSTESRAAFRIMEKDGVVVIVEE
jgi:hypothetical protein